VSTTIVARSAPAVAPSVPHIDPLVGKPARVAAAVQGEQWLARLDVAAASEHVEVFGHVDARGDEIRARIWKHEDDAIAALRAGHPSEALAELLAARALRPRYEECDAYEGEHVGEIGTHAAGADGALVRSGALLSALLGQKGDGMALADRLLAGLAPDQCGKRRQDSGGVVFRPCARLAGHNGRCGFVAVATAPASLP
jgi:hypothetical protein